MSESDTLSEQPRVSVWRRVLLGLGVLIGLMLVAGVVVQMRDGSAAQMKKIVAELDETDPNWRLDDLARARPEVPEHENSARVAMGVVRLLPKDPATAQERGKAQVELEEKLQDLGEKPTMHLDAEQMALLEKWLGPKAAAVALARRLADMPRGRHRLTLATNPLGTLLPDQQETRSVASLLRYDALLRAHKKDIDGALVSCRACLNAGRSLGDEPFLVSQLIRIACIFIACNQAERALAQGEATDAELLALQKLLAEEDRDTAMVAALRGERAIMDDLFRKMEDGTLKTQELFGTRSESMPQGTSWRVMLLGFSRADFRRDHLLALEMMNKLVEAGRLPEHEQAARNSALEAEIKALPQDAVLARMLLPAVTKVGEAHRRKTAQVRALMALLAVERYRLKHGKWPGKLDDLKPDFLTAIPLDPYDGKPLRYVKRADGVTVYSVGHDGVDDGGKIDRTKPLTAKGLDQGHRLWDVKARRQAPAPKPAPPAGPPIP
jgi:hypothetical protein